ncbi:MAG: VOC family protein [Thermoleophilia bacterium]|nr:VOC family protein [Thermoleophilia bacterium]
MRFGYTILYVEDVEQTIEFYERAFGVQRSEIVTPEYGELATGATVLSFARHDIARGNSGTNFRMTHPKQLPPAFEVAFLTDDVQAAYDTAIEAGASEVNEPAEKPWGQTVAYVRDINGVLVEICTPVH